MVEITNDFHGTSYRLPRKKVGDPVSRSTLRRVARALCGIADCQCGREDGSRGSRYYLESINPAPDAQVIVRDGKDWWAN